MVRLFVNISIIFLDTYTRVKSKENAVKYDFDIFLESCIIASRICRVDEANTYFVVVFYSILFVDTSDKLTISPRPSQNLYNKLLVKEGETIGPYTCTADCNPPCDIMWKYKDSTTGGFFDVASTGLLDSQIVNRSIALYRCIAQYSPDKDFKIIENIILVVLCKYRNLN